MGLELFGLLLASLIHGTMITVYGTSVSCPEEILNLTFTDLKTTIVQPTTQKPSSDYNKLVITK